MQPNVEVYIYTYVCPFKLYWGLLFARVRQIHTQNLLRRAVGFHETDWLMLRRSAKDAYSSTAAPAAIAAACAPVIHAMGPCEGRFNCRWSATSHEIKPVPVSQAAKLGTASLRLASVWDCHAMLTTLARVTRQHDKHGQRRSEAQCRAQTP